MLTSVHGTAHCGLLELSWVRVINCAALAPVTGPFPGAGGRQSRHPDVQSSPEAKHTGQALESMPVISIPQRRSC
jgi:hypothetical protein